jgi:hypothetical protein
VRLKAKKCPCGVAEVSTAGFSWWKEKENERGRAGYLKGAYRSRAVDARWVQLEEEIRCVDAFRRSYCHHENPHKH